MRITRLNPESRSFKNFSSFRVNDDSVCFTSLSINIICAALTCNTFFSVKSAYYCVAYITQLRFKTHRIKGFVTKATNGLRKLSRE